MNSLRAAWRLGRAVLHALAGLGIILFVFPRRSELQRNAHVQAWALKMLALLGIRLELHGQPPACGPVLLVANHISWLDILVMHAARHCRFVAKAEVRHWPLIGRLATGGGTLYIERESRRDAMRVVHHMAESLKRGEIVAVFPEGTTSDGQRPAAFPRQPDPGGDFGGRAGPARRLELHRHGDAQDEPRALLHRRRFAGAVALAHAGRPADHGGGPLRHAAEGAGTGPARVGGRVAFSRRRFAPALNRPRQRLRWPRARRASGTARP